MLLQCLFNSVKEVNIITFSNNMVLGFRDCLSLLYASSFSRSHIQLLAFACKHNTNAQAMSGTQCSSL